MVRILFPFEDAESDREKSGYGGEVGGTLTWLNGALEDYAKLLRELNFVCDSILTHMRVDYVSHAI